ncbi:MAG: cytochrome c oxidase assembly protein [Thiobacillus sp.]|nr:cytochrome c oxidase assembly protein [Thiobacillus sp.]MBC2738256.1 cytochrome c oxidase assembly protein [Thiobacillus sp.]MBC2761564.1 cytochrome c oxidase assembly protein [Thiobacillus sp.]
MQSIALFLSPWEFSPTVLLLCAGSVLLYVRGLRHASGEATSPGFWRIAAFFVGLTSIYAFLQTHLDYLSQHMFWIHRLQHLVLHHAGPFLIALAAPLEIMALGTPRWLRRGLFVPVFNNPLTLRLYRLLQHPVVAPLLFTGLIGFWLIPSVHFKAMLSLARYDVMNWSMLIDGLLFWWLIVGPEKHTGLKPLGYGTRIIMLWAIMLPQIAIGAYIALSSTILYTSYSVCGRAWPIAPMTDQDIGGLITWIPAAMMSAVGALVVLRRWRNDSHSERSRQSPLGVEVQ